MMKMNDEKEPIRKEYKECMLSTHAVESSGGFLLQAKANQCTQNSSKKVSFKKETLKRDMLRPNWCTSDLWH